MNLFLILITILLLLVIFILVADLINRFKFGYTTLKKTKFDEIFPKASIDVFSDQVGQFKFNRKQAKNYGRTYRQWFFGFNLFNVIRASEVEKIIVNQKQIAKSYIYTFLHPFLRSGLLTSDGPKWMKHRKILTPAFHFNILSQQFYAIIQEQSRNFVKTLEQNDERVTNLTQEIPQFAINTLSETAMGVKLSDNVENRTYRKCIHDLGIMLLLRACRPWLHSDFIYKLLGYQKQLDNVLERVHNFTKSVIQMRRNIFLDTRNNNLDYRQNEENIYETKKRRYAMLDTLLAAEKDGLIDSEGIEEEVDTFMFAGHDTTSVGIIFILFTLAQHPEVQDKILEELNDSCGSDEVSFNDLSNMKYLDRVVKECLRIYPPVPFIARQIAEEVDYDGFVLPAGSVIHFHIFDLHRDPEQFPDPEKFDPDRFLPENIGKRHPFAYIPFSAGPRNCIGQKFALLEIKTLLVTLLPKFEILPVTKKEDLVFLADMVLRTRDPVKVAFKPRT